jgi:hypothetical protein
VRRALPLLVSLCAVAAVIVPYVALGGASYAPTPLADPCARAPSQANGLSEALEQVALTGLDSAACKLGVAREDLVLAIRSEDALDRFAEKTGIDSKDAEQAIQDGLLQALDDARESGTLSGLVAGLAERVIETVRPHLLIEALERIGSLLP